MFANIQYLQRNILAKCIANRRSNQFNPLKHYSSWMRGKKNDHQNASQVASKILDEKSEDFMESCYFKNGMRLICECTDTCTTSIGFTLPAGSIHETSEERGSSLFLEHLLFKRTTGRNQQQLETAVENMGGVINTASMRDSFLFYGVVPSEQVESLVELFADVILNGVVDETTTEAAKCVILNYLENMELDKEKIIMDYLPMSAYQGTPLEKSIYPETSVIKNFSAQCLLSFRNRLMKTYCLTMVSIGPLPLCDLQKLICQYFCTEVCEDMPRMEEEKLSYRFTGADFRLRDDKEETGYVALGIEGPNYAQCQDHIALTVAQQFVGSWNKASSGANHNAPFIAHCAFNTNLCHTYKSFFLNWKRASIWGCYFECDKLQIENMILLIQREWRRLYTSITEKEVKRAINQCRMQELMKFSDPVERLLDILDNFSKRGYYETIHIRLSRYEMTTADSIREVADKYIYNQSPVVVGIGRIENLPDYCNIENGMYSLRY